MTCKCNESLIPRIEKRLDKIEEKLDAALKFKWTVVGVVTGVSSVSAVVFALLKIL